MQSPSLLRKYIDRWNKDFEDKIKILKLDKDLNIILEIKDPSFEVGLL